MLTQQQPFDLAFSCGKLRLNLWVTGASQFWGAEHEGLQKVCPQCHRCPQTLASAHLKAELAAELCYTYYVGARQQSGDSFTDRGLKVTEAIITGCLQPAEIVPGMTRDDGCNRE